MNKHIHQLISQGENQQLDFKFEINDSKKIARSLSAFANTNGGRLLIGVKDNGVIAGINSDEEYYMVEAAAQLYSKPEIKFDVYKWDIDGRTILEVIVNPSPKKPHTAPNKEGKMVAYIRVDDENIIAHSILVKAWEKQRSKKGVNINGSDRHNYILELFRNEGTLNISQLCKLAFMPTKDVESILIDLLALNLITIDCNENSAFFQELKQ